MWGTRAAPVLVLGLALVAAGCTGDGSDDGDPVAVGQIVESPTEVPGRHVFVQTPDGRIDFTVTAPLDEISVLDAPSGRAPEDGALVGVSWVWDFRTAYAAMAVPDGEVEPSIRLVADGREYSLDEAVLREGRRSDEPVLDYDGTAYVGVDGKPEELAIAVEYDGLDQVVEVGATDVLREGPAAGLYLQPDALARHDVSCGKPVAAGRGTLPDRTGQCRLTVARVPYEPTAGWVEGPEKRWLQVEARVWPSGFPQIGGRSCGEGVLGPVRYRLEGAAPESEVPADPDDTLAGDRLVFATGASGPDELRISAVQTFPDEPSCPALRLSWTAYV